VTILQSASLHAQLRQKGTVLITRFDEKIKDVLAEDQLGFRTCVLASWTGRRYLTT